MSNRTLPPVAADLVKAKKRIENPKNWCKGGYTDGKGYCALGALGYGIDPVDINYDQLMCTKYFKHVSYLARAIPSESRIHTYNDYKSTTHEDIMALYDRAIGLAIEDNR